MDNIAYRAARRRVMRRFFLQISFVANMLFFILVTLEIIRQSDPDLLLELLIWVVIWGTILVGHAMLAFNLLGKRIHRATMHELERETPQEKPKRHYVEISDDGELLDVGVDAPAAMQHTSKNG